MTRNDFLLMRLILSIIGNSLGIWLSQRFIDGFIFSGELKELAIIGIVLALFNLLIKPAIKFITTPLIILTLGLFILIINALLLWTTDYIFDFLLIENLWALIWATILIGIVNFIVNRIYKIAK